MKKIIVISGFLLGTFAVHAQETGKQEIRLGYSDGIFLSLGNGFSDTFSNSINSALTGAKYKDDVMTKTLGMLEVGYRYNINKRLKVGGDISYMKEENTYEFVIPGTTKTQNETRKNQYSMVLLIAEFSYIKTSWLNFYGSGGIGSIVRRSNDYQGSHIKDEAQFAFQINPVGLRVGKKLGAFAELGLGYKGIATIGANYKF
jgi:opacity protein-like surface antigen